jgi:hypothetical protein
MSHDEYLSRLHHGIRAQGREGGNEGKAVQAIISAREKDSDADDANKEKMKKVKPKTNVYQ